MKKKLQTADIERIYVCRTDEENSSIIEKVLIQYADGSKGYVEFPSSDSKMNHKKQMAYQNLLNDLEDLFQQNNSSKDNQDNGKVITIFHEDKELIEYVNYQIELMKNKNSTEREKTSICVGLFNFSIALLPPFSFATMLNNIISSINFALAIKNNKTRKNLEIENQMLKKLKLYFSYLMLSLNIGLNVRNLSVNFDKMSHDITLMKVMVQQVSVVSNLDNPFADSDSQLLVTTSDANTNLLMEAFQLNPFLDETDLEIALSTRNYMEDNPYLNYEKLYEKFASFGVIHTNYKKGGSAGDYDTKSNIINIYDYDNAKKAPYYIRTVAHEIIHFTGNLDNITHCAS